MGVSEYLLEDDDALRALLRRVHRVAVLGIKTEAQADKPAFYVAQYLVAAGLELVPVPVYYPEVTSILGRPVYRRLRDIPGPVDLVNVFRRPEDLPGHVEDILEKKPVAVWFQLGISHPQVAERLAQAGIQVVQDRCLLVEHQRLVGARIRSP